jgi:hypothetical protein
MCFIVYRGVVIFLLGKYGSARIRHKFYIHKEIFLAVKETWP